MTFRKSHWRTLFYEILRGGLLCFSLPVQSNEPWQQGRKARRWHDIHIIIIIIKAVPWGCRFEKKSLMQLLSNGKVHMTHLWTPLFNMFWRVKLWWLFGIFGIRDPHPQSIFWPKQSFFRANKPFWRRNYAKKCRQYNLRLTPYLS